MKHSREGLTTFPNSSKFAKTYSVTVHMSYFELSSHVWKCGQTWPLCLIYKLYYIHAHKVDQAHLKMKPFLQK